MEAVILVWPIRAKRKDREFVTELDIYINKWLSKKNIFINPPININNPDYAIADSKYSGNYLQMVFPLLNK